ncbi:transcriptional regulator [Bacillus sp. FJAT-22090]|uniref:response regulator transcription factor n=1 Tax=Bacillus sp. FJAT-22090 TaxID=1581038 RepID=UPI0006B0390D|nr:response regulator transcription factor [Bacillus sp. FJAT-22090]ALC87808.1 transcriptional regulator [Bacillus sp. FJAT-22090]
MKIMIIEDDVTIRDLLSDTLKKWSFEVAKLEEFDRIIEAFIHEDPHLLLLDINLPFFDGFHWCRQIREISQVPIIFLSSRNTPLDTVLAMNMGGDDFIQKPFDTDVLLAKINAILRRSYSYTNFETNLLEYDGVVLNLKDREVIYRDRKAELTKTEFVILKLLMENKESIVHRSKIMRKLWKDENFIDNNTLTVNIARLRKKLIELGKENFIATKKGEGYTIK